MKKIVICIFSTILVFMMFGCAKKEEQPIYSSQNASSEIASEHNSANVQYREVETLIEDALNEIGIYDAPENIDIQSEETMMISADISFDIQGKRLVASCFNATGDWNISFISKADDREYFYWIPEHGREEHTMHEFE